MKKFKRNKSSLQLLATGTKKFDTNRLRDEIREVIKHDGEKSQRKPKKVRSEKGDIYEEMKAGE